MPTGPLTVPMPAELPLEPRGRGWVVALPDGDLEVSNPDKPYWVEEGYTKGDLLGYFYNIAEYLLPYVRDRPLMLRRMPDGVEGEGFFAKQAPPHTPTWMSTATVTSVSDDHTVEYLLAQDTRSLLWLANLGAIELHPWHSRVDDPGRPDYAFFDLDPVGADFDVVREVALLVRAALDHLGLVGVPRTSGARGMQVFVPLRRAHSAAAVRAFVHAVCQHIHRVAPERTTLRWRVAERPEAVYLDYGMNAEGKSLAATYSPRPEPHAPVATPLTWGEVEEGIRPQDFTIASIWSRLDALGGDPGTGIVEGDQDLRAAMSILGVADAEAPARHRVKARRGEDPSPRFAPMLATAWNGGGFDDPEWRFEVKWDGVRALATVVAGVSGEVRLHTRAGNDVTATYPEAAELAQQVRASSAVLDGELVALDDDGLPSFQRLQHRMHRRLPPPGAQADVPVTYVVFDLLAVDGSSLLERPLHERLARLDDVLEPRPPIVRSEGVHEHGTAMLSSVAERGLEGLIAKRLASPYRPGRRSHDWLKLKVRRRARCVIGGWTPGQGARAGSFASLLLGVWDSGSLRFVGRVGTGFTDRELDRLSAMLGERTIDRCPFDDGPVPPRDGRWVRPDLACWVEYAEVTDDGRLRAPAYKGLVTSPTAGEV
ncbi:hypothetical protein ER308_01320 [Egibacter rhizosphaerae]|uniref:DNA ligase (ATP) n=1 Tax=Egibacter rhizosphaerae TaxID=1670831 RepID=A0A411YAV9_9ACTN|nr:non-homologous end-joining DNA ligase [Egibacter rhizosphaerae]QBI18344.1 hypothetical protein ER308_01320 [Egibacter rhizosphaerae]